MSGPRYRAIYKNLIKLASRKFHQMFQAWHRAGRKRQLFSERRAAVPWTNLLADVASENVRPHPLAMLLRDRAAQLNREVRNAAPRIERPSVAIAGAVRHKCLRRTGVDATGARPAAIRRR